MTVKKDDNELSYRFKVNMFSHGIKSKKLQTEVIADVEKNIRRQIGYNDNPSPPLSKAVKSSLKK